MRPFLEELQDQIHQLRRQDLERRLEIERGIDFTSNDYLGLSKSPELQRRLLERLAEESEFGLGAPSSRLLRGHTEAHRRLETRLASWKGTEAALLFPSGYQANLGILSTLIGPRDRVLSDEFNHASLIDGLRLSRGHKVIFPHRDLQAVEAALAEPFPGGRTFLVTESLFSMDGTLAPVAKYAELTQNYGAELIVDEAHATGLYGERGSGLAEAEGITSKTLALISTGGKALGVSGAFVAGSQTLIDYLIQRCRAFIFSTAVPPLLVEALRTALDLVEENPERRRRVLELADALRSRLREAGYDVPGDPSPIVPIVLGENLRALEVARSLQEQGFDVRAVRPPTVPEGTTRLRLSVHADHREEDLNRLVEALTQAVRDTHSQEVTACP